MQYFKLVIGNKRIKFLVMFIIIIMFIFAIGYSLSFFQKDNSKMVVNIKVNDLLFNLTSNTGESDDRVLKLSSNSTESFNTTITNLNKIDVKYELIYKLCTDIKCTSFYDSLPSDLFIGVNSYGDNETNGVFYKGNNTYKDINIITVNKTDIDYYILLDLNAGYVWNDLSLFNMFEKKDVETKVNDINTNIVAYVDGIKVSDYPVSCNYYAKIYKKVNDVETELLNSNLYCDRKTNKWEMTLDGFYENIVVKFSYHVGAPTFTYTGEFEIVNENASDWKIRFLTSGTLIFAEEISPIDVFLVGGGGGGGAGFTWYNRWGELNMGGGGGGGAGGFGTTAKKVNVIPNNEYIIKIGDGGLPAKDGIATEAFDLTANGGGAGTAGQANDSYPNGGPGVGGIGGNNGGAGYGDSTENSFAGASGNIDLREFGEENGDLYAGGGGGGGGYNGYVGNTAAGDGGQGGGGAGGSNNGVRNTGGGGGGGTASSYAGTTPGGAGGSGIVIIRGHVE